MLMVVVAAVVAADLMREDTGFLAATLMGIALGNQPLIAPSRRIDVSAALVFQATLVQLLVGVLFVLIAASVSTGDVEAVLPEALVLVAVMALLIRPAAVLLATVRSRFTWRERSFVAWMAPRGIVAGATASAFGLQLAQKGTAGADDVLPIVFAAIFGTVVLYGLTAPLAARALGLAGKEHGLVWFHDLRHSGAVLAASTGATIAELMGRLGQSSPQAAMRYQHVAAGRDQVIAELLSKLADDG